MTSLELSLSATPARRSSGPLDRLAVQLHPPAPFPRILEIKEDGDDIDPKLPFVAASRVAFDARWTSRELLLARFR